jgi:uncharacterized protein YukE
VAQIFGNPEEIRNFMNKLSVVNLDIENSLNSLISSYNYLGESWNDSKSLEFSDKFNEFIQSFNNFNYFTQASLSYLNNLANKLEEYQDCGR